MRRMKSKSDSHRSAASCIRWFTASLALVLFVAMGLHSPSAFAASARDFTLGQPTALNARAPGNVPSNYVITPDGYFHPSCVNVVASDESVDAHGNIVAADGRVRQMSPCTYPHYSADGTRLHGDALPRISTFTANATNVINGWVVTGQYLQPRTAAARALAANMTVPPGPSVQSGQVLYLFPGLEDNENVVTIVQPVLAWNGFNDNTWTVASWNCCRNGRALHSAPVAVATGDTILGSMKGARCANGSCAIWSIVSNDVTNGKSTTLKTSSYGQVFDWVFGGVLEVYGVSQCGEFPNTTTQDFTDISARAIGPITQPWQQMLIANSPACGYSAAGFPNADSPNVRLTF